MTTLVSIDVISGDTKFQAYPKKDVDDALEEKDSKIASLQDAYDDAMGSLKFLGRKLMATQVALWNEKAERYEMMLLHIDWNDDYKSMDSLDRRSGRLAWCQTYCLNRAKEIESELNKTNNQRKSSEE